MVKADENSIQAIINTVKGLPVECKSFDVADSWVGIVLELERIAENTIVADPVEVKPQEPPKPVEIRYAPPENILKDSEEIKNG